MEGVIDTNVPLDYIEFQIFPSQNRYEACVCYDDKIEKVTSGLVEHLVLHSDEVKKLYAQGANTSFKLQPPEDFSEQKWFTKSTFIRFLHIIGLSNILNIINPVKNEISQLEEVRRFQLSLYAKGTQDQLKNGELDNGCSSGMSSVSKSEESSESSDASKDELLRAMELRITALEEELVAAFDKAAGFRYSVEEITDIEKFSHHLGSMDLRDSLHKYVESRGGNPAVNISDEQNTGTDKVSGKEGKDKIKSYSETRVKYGASPAKLAQVERQSSSESEDSSFSSEEEQPSVERSRTLIRSASPRRSASPMRRVQIGRSGSRRSTALTIKSLNYFPARERSVLPKDPVADNSDEESIEEASKKSDSNVRRMSVQDAISLFESKQKDQTTDIQKARSMLSATVGANKSVLRRWSSAVGESSQCSPDMDPEEDPKIPNNLENKEISHSSPEAMPEAVEPCGVNVTLNSPVKGACGAAGMQEETLPSQSTVDSEKLIASAEWSRQKEAELNQLLMKMMETKPVKYRNVVPENGKSEKLPSEHRGGRYNHYKEKREEKLGGETTRNQTKKEKQVRAMQQILDSRKAEIDSPTVGQVGKRNNVKKVQKSQRSPSQSANHKSASTNSGVVKKTISKSSSLPATRKSWPSAPSPRAPGTSPAKVPAGTTFNGTTPTRRKSQPASPVSRSAPALKVETSQPKSKPVKTTQSDTKKNVRSVADRNQQQTLTKTSRKPKTKVQSSTEDPISSAKRSSYGKITKKSSVVPLEPKPFLRKGSGTVSSANPSGKTKSTAQQKDPLRNSADVITAAENEIVSNSSDVFILQQEMESERLKVLDDVDSETQAKSPHKCEDTESSIDVTPANYNSFDSMQETEIKPEVEEESTISPTAWVKMEELDVQAITSGDICQIESPTHIARNRGASPRVRHSLSQMLLEESSEPDISEWGNAENPPAMVYHKDAPKGLKRLLKFARKSKTDANSAGWSSPSVFSEGEDETDDSKFSSKRSAENLLKKATLHSKNNGHRKASSETLEKKSVDYVHHAQSNISKYSAPSLSQQLREGHVSASATTTKATRSFFSLSAFKGGK